jgi:hypothetical protein
LVFKLDPDGPPRDLARRAGSTLVIPAAGPDAAEPPHRMWIIS